MASPKQTVVLVKYMPRNAANEQVQDENNQNFFLMSELFPWQDAQVDAIVVGGDAAAGAPAINDEDSKNFKINLYGQTFDSIQRAFAYVKFALIGQKSYAKQVLQAITDRREFIDKQKISTFVQTEYPRETASNMADLIKSFYKLEETQFTQEFKVLLMEFLISQAISGKNSDLFDKFVMLQFPKFLLQVEKRNDLWALDSESGENKYGLLLKKRHDQLTKQVPKNGFSLFLKEALDQMYKANITFPFIKSASESAPPPTDANKDDQSDSEQSDASHDAELFQEDDDAMKQLKYAKVFVANGNFDLVGKVFYHTIEFDSNLFPRTIIKEKNIVFHYKNEKSKKNTNAMDEDSESSETSSTSGGESNNSNGNEVYTFHSLYETVKPLNLFYLNAGQVIQDEKRKSLIVPASDSQSIPNGSSDGTGDVVTRDADQRNLAQHNALTLLLPDQKNFKNNKAYLLYEPPVNYESTPENLKEYITPVSVKSLLDPRIIPFLKDSDYTSQIAAVSSATNDDSGGGGDSQSAPSQQETVDESESKSEIEHADPAGAAVPTWTFVFSQII